MNNNYLKENTKHGDFNLPFTTYHGYMDENFPMIPMHWHEEIEVIYVQSGECDIKIDLNTYKAKPNSLYILKPLSIHSVKSNIANPATFYSFVFNMNMLQSALTDGCTIKYIAPILSNEIEFNTIIDSNSKGFEEILITFFNIFNCFKDKNNCYELEIKSLLFHLFFLLHKNRLVKNISKSHALSVNATSKIKNILQYITDNYSSQITISNVAEISGFSEYHLMKFFKKHIGMTCVEYINTYRLGKATELLLDTDMSIMDVSLEVGFNSVSYFNKLFKSKFNITPKEFRYNPLRAQLETRD